ncbi:MAG: VOC family protein [Thermoplasmata archaeon]|nr:VOC family protein [Thermoplasmata archaeon]
MSDVITGLSAVSVHIRDIQKARSFYRDVLGLKELSFDDKGSRASFVLPDSSTVLRMHIQGPDEGGREPGTVTGILFRHPDPAAACAEIKRRGGTVANESRRVELPGIQFDLAVIADPDGNEFIITNRPG